MKILKRTLLIILVLLVLAQVPFIYRRYQIGNLAEKISQAESQRTTYTDPNFKEYKGIIHAHTSLGGHSTGTFDELIAAANSNDLDFVLMTEHYSDTFDTAAQTLNGVYGKTLFIGGNEIDTSDGDRFLLIPGGGEAAKARMSGTTAFLEAAHRENKLALITYPEKFISWDSEFDGVEVFSLHTAAKQMNPLAAFGDLIWSYPSYPELVLAMSFQRPDANLAKFDEIAAKRPISLFAGTDAHSNIGFHIFGDDAGNKLINIKVDPYATILRMARIHVVARIDESPEATAANITGSIRGGRYFIGIDAIGDSTGFIFAAYDDKPLPPQLLGGEISSDSPGLKLKASSPLSARFVLLKNGEIFLQSESVSAIEALPSGPGVYRVEVYRDDLGPPFDKMPWIISNPIYVR